MLSARRFFQTLPTATALLWTFPALAQTSAPATSSDTIWSRAHLFGDMGGLRTVLARYGATLNVTDSENLLANLAGGVKQGATMQGVTTGTLDVDAGKALGLQGGRFYVTDMQIHGQSLSGPYLDNLQTANGNEAEDTTRLWELWYDQAFLSGAVDIKIGQQSIDNEFIVSRYSGLFVNTMAGWPLLPSADLYGGGPAYPLSSLGVRLQAKPTDSTTILAGVFDDNPGGGAFRGNAQELDKNGVEFNLNTGALFIAELQHATKIGELDGTYKIGGWYDTGFFADQRLGNDGLSLADANSNGTPVMHRGNYSLYAVADQTVWQSKSDTSRALNVFGRIMGAPDDRNLVDFFFNGGVTLTAPLPGRDNDQAGIDFGIGRVSSQAATFAQDSGAPRLTTEELIELTYGAQATGWLTVQPDLQYVINPGAGVLDPNDPTHILRNEFIVGMRAIVTF
ncbi:MAG: carbohydrate porin [Proteobacteria bacterium]|nr:carbohydrate porin [Pseudomonadota bacterium]